MSLAERFAGSDAESLEARMAAGGQVPPGFHKAAMIGAKAVTSKQKGTAGHELTFKITDGPFKDAEVTDTLWDTEHQRSQDRIALFMLRLGVLQRSKDGKKIIAVEGKQDFMDVLDTPCIIETAMEEYKRDDGQTGHSVRLAFGGCYYPDDKEALAKVGKPVEAAKATPAGGSTAKKDATKTPAKEPAAAAKSKVDTSQL